MSRKSDLELLKLVEESNKMTAEAAKVTAQFLTYFKTLEQLREDGK